MLSARRAAHSCEECLPQHFQNHAVRGLLPCPQCQVGLREHDYSSRTPDELAVERALQIRRQIKKEYPPPSPPPAPTTRVNVPSLLGSFNKLEADFDTPRAYNDYLEQVELLIYAKVYPDGGEEPKVSWGGREYTHEEHKRENAEEIRQNRRKRDDEKKARERKVAEEKERLAELHKSWDEEEMMNERDKQAKEERRMDDIVNKTPRSSPDPDRALLQQQQLQQQQQQQQQQQMQRGHQHLARMYIEKLERPAAKKPRPTKDGWSAEQPRWTPGHGSHACPPWIDPDTKHKVKGKRSRGSR
eukprot:COSAG04_NODE_6119_length_1404_cov_2.329502_1_plen_300_part_10